MLADVVIALLDSLMPYLPPFSLLLLLTFSLPCRIALPAYLLNAYLLCALLSSRHKARLPATLLRLRDRKCNV